MTDAASTGRMKRRDRGDDWSSFLDALEGLQVISDPRVLEVKSRDCYWYSPILKASLHDKLADLVVMSQTEADVLRVAKACVQWKVPLTVRAAGTGNYGQAIPLAGGVVLDVSPLKEIAWIKSGMARVQGGVKLLRLDVEARRLGWELRMYPSTKRLATIGGFVAGGSMGVGSIMYGPLAHRGNLNVVRVVTMEDEPRVLELRGDDVLKVHHAYGTNGIIVDLELPLSPVHPWVDLIVTFERFMDAVRFSQALGESDGIVKKLITVFAWPIPQYFTRLTPPLPPGTHAVFLMVAHASLEALETLVREHRGAVCYREPSDDAGTAVPLYEYTWNHTTLHAIRCDPSITYLQSMFPPGRNLELIEHMYDHFGGEVMLHLEAIRLDGTVTHTSLQVVRFTTEARLNDIIAYHEDHGVTIFNPHTHILEDGGLKKVDENQLAFKRLVDPHGLMNPGKMRGWWER